MNKSILAIYSILFISFALFFTSCPSPSSGGGSDDGGSQGYSMDFGSNDGASIEVAIDFSRVAEKARADYFVVEVYESTDSSENSAINSDYTVISNITGDSFEFSITGVKAGYWYKCGLNIIDEISGEYFDLSYDFTVLTQAVAGSKVTATLNSCSIYDGQYTGDDKAGLSGTIDLSALNQSLINYCVIVFYADDGYDNTDDPNLRYEALLDGSLSVSYHFDNLDPDPSYSWKVHADFEDWNASTHAKDEYSITGGDDSVSISSGSNSKDFAALHTFDTNDKYDGGNGNAAIIGTLDLSNLASDTYAIIVECEVDDFSYYLDYEFLNIELNDTLTYRFTSLDPDQEHTLTYDIFTEISPEHWMLPEISVSPDDLSDGTTTTVDFMIPAP